ncbi:helix-turn-helix domain-containing protein [Sphingomonas sp.]|jgi:DNA-binding MarR family transcriptional regulator|uniref:MarR family winged helix-turn-helix transcriptional regulator n=1 Tax=Sphingomonas sp. TaxID=28214 RepID=UPI002E30D9B9|nr:helix-turn-helix domain-containing protein [Sphingomonas sp.]HEX4695598.1 helix-turn-helix domain-containing protein [Sphingomonas sp.]
MTATTPAASAQFLRESEIRRGNELLFFAYTRVTRAVDARLGANSIGRAHHRSLYFIGRHPDISVSELLAILGVTKQSLGRVLTELEARGLIETRIGERDRRQRLLRLTEAGSALDTELFNAWRHLMAHAYTQAGQAAVTGFWAVLEGLIPESERARVRSWQETGVPPGQRG